ncbi:dentin sialophosphoprotein-like isoform X2 [Palaemon carinicauda]|uniref:dentin sialophosphoprotein-like isoform X2 n=1 Tax=Palaemon carinicauda TaxID=392227 RepID=UPI0035B62C6A
MPKIDPLQLLKCLSILLNANGGIRGETEVPRVKGLMSKYSKKLVSKCIYLNILQATDYALLDAFYDEGGWELVGTWLQEAVKASNWPLSLQVLSLLETSPMSVTRLKRYATPRLVKELSRECVNADVQNMAKQIVLKWMEVVIQGDGSGTIAGVGLSGGGSSADSPLSVSDSSDSKPSKMSVGENSSSAENSAAPAVNSDSTHEGGDGSSSGEGQDDSSNASTESDTTPAPTTPIRITIRSGSQVLAKVSSQRVSQDSNDSDDNKPLSIIRKEVRKARISDEEVSNSTTEPDVTPEKKGVSDVGNTNNAAEDGASGAVNNCVTSSTNSLSNENGDVEMTDISKTAENTATSTTTTMSNSVVSSAVSSSGSVSNSAPSSSSEAEGESAMETNSEVEKASDKDVLSSDTRENKSVNNNDENSDSRGEETDSGKEKTGLKNEKDPKSSKDKSKDKDKHRDSEKKDKREKEHDKDKKSKDDKKKEKDKDSKSSKSSSSSSSSSRSDKSSKSDKHRSSSSHSKSGKDKDRESSSKSRDRDKDRSKSSRDKDRKSSSSSSKDKSKDKEREDKHDKKKEQENEDKATLEKVKPLSADGLAKIPRKTTSSFLDALGSADSDASESKKPSVKTYKSRGFRNTGLLDEPTKPPGKKAQPGGASDKKSTSGTPGQGVKRPSPLDELVASSSIPDKRLKSSVSSSPLTSDKPGGVKLISPKRPSLSDDGGFMAALTASGTDSRKKITRKRKSSESDSSSKQDGKEDEKKEDDKSPVSSPVKATEDKNLLLSPTSVKPTFNFYQETLKDDTDEEKKEGSDKETSETKEEKEGSENGESSAEGGEGGDADTPSASQADNDSDNMDIDESEDQDDSVQIGLGESFGGGGVNGQSGDAGLRDEDIPIAPAVPAPAQEDYEKVEVTFSEPTHGVRGVLVYHRPEGRKKKSVKWKTEEDLKEVFLFEMDETERVNVNTIKFNEMMVLEKQREREAMGKSRGFHGNMMGGNMNMMGGNNHMMGMGMHHGQNVIEYMRWSLLPIMIPSPKVTPGYKSQERVTQAARESSTMAAFYNPAMLPETPREPDPEMVSRTEPKEIPLNDVTGQDVLYDHRNKMWPEPLFMEPVNYGFGAMGGPSSGGNEGGSHWVVGGPPAGGFPPGPGGPMYPPGGFGGPGMGGPGMGGPPMGGPGMGGPPGGFGGDMGGGMDVPGWGGPAPGPPGSGPGMDYPNPNMMMGGGNQGMMMGGGGGGRPPGSGVPRGMMHNMGMGGQGFRGRNGPGGGNWGPGPSNYVKPVCKHFMNGHCRHGPKCRFLHSRH